MCIDPPRGGWSTWARITSLPQVAFPRQKESGPWGGAVHRRHLGHNTPHTPRVPQMVPQPFVTPLIRIRGMSLCPGRPPAVPPPPPPCFAADVGGWVFTFEGGGGGVQ